LGKRGSPSRAKLGGEVTEKKDGQVAENRRSERKIMSGEEGSEPGERREKGQSKKKDLKGNLHSAIDRGLGGRQSLRQKKKEASKYGPLRKFRIHAPLNEGGVGSRWLTY